MGRKKSKTHNDGKRIKGIEWRRFKTKNFPRTLKKKDFSHEKGKYPEELKKFRLKLVSGLRFITS